MIDWTDPKTFTLREAFAKDIGGIVEELGISEVVRDNLLVMADKLMDLYDFSDVKGVLTEEPPTSMGIFLLFIQTIAAERGTAPSDAIVH
jgi:hypothetical protein